MLAVAADVKTAEVDNVSFDFVVQHFLQNMNEEELLGLDTLSQRSAGRRALHAR